MKSNSKTTFSKNKNQTESSNNLKNFNEMNSNQDEINSIQISQQDPITNNQKPKPRINVFKRDLNLLSKNSFSDNLTDEFKKLNKPKTANNFYNRSKAINNLASKFQPIERIQESE